jgi:death on curing protein
MRYLTLGEVVELHRLLGGTDLHQGLIEAAALGFALAQGHAFVDGNKRVAHAAMATFLLLNGAEISAAVDEQERLDLASGRVSPAELASWLEQHVSRPPDQAV